MAVDGPANTVVEIDSVPSRSRPGEPARERLGHPPHADHATRPRARGDTSQATARFWKIESTTETGVGRARRRPTQLMPGSTVPPMYSPDALFAPRSGFTEHTLWVTAHDPEQRFAAGDYPLQAPVGTGLPHYLDGDRPLEGSDVVVWYTFGAHHVVRPEDWPVMPVSTIGFMLRPERLLRRQPRARPAADGVEALSLT